MEQFSIVPRYSDSFLPWGTLADDKVLTRANPEEVAGLSSAERGAMRRLNKPLIAGRRGRGKSCECVLPVDKSARRGR